MKINKNIIEDYRRQLNSAKDDRATEKIFVNFYRRAEAEDNRALHNLIVADAAFCWSMFEDEVKNFLRG